MVEKPGEITVTMTNPFPFDLEDVAATLTPPDDSDEWTIEAVSENMDMDVLSPGETVEFTWEVTPPGWLPGTYEMELAVEYVRTNDSNSFVQTATVATNLEGNDGVTATSATGTASTDADGPGFGVGGALTGLGGAGYLLHRRLTGTDADGEADEDE
jgi:PGF-CTERM protein